MSDSFEQTQRNFVHRLPSRGTLDKAEIFSILDAGFLCHLGFESQGQTYVIPTLYARSGERLYLHGSAASRMLRQLETGCPICMCVTHVDGLVLARSAFHHSVNYRSVVIFGTASIVTDPLEKAEALRLFTDWMVPGRSNELRASTENELRATSVLAVQIEHASGKVRRGPPLDDPEDLDQPVWAGVLPMSTTFGPQQPDRKNAQDLAEFDMERVAKHGNSKR